MTREPIDLGVAILAQESFQTKKTNMPEQWWAELEINTVFT